MAEYLDFPKAVKEAVTDRGGADPLQSDVVRAALSGELSLAVPTAREYRAANLELYRRIRDRAGAAAFGELLASEERTIVVLGEDGRPIERGPDGATRFVRSQPDR